MVIMVKRELELSCWSSSLVITSYQLSHDSVWVIDRVTHWCLQFHTVRLSKILCELQLVNAYFLKPLCCLGLSYICLVLCVGCSHPEANGEWASLKAEAKNSDLLPQKASIFCSPPLMETPLLICSFFFSFLTFILSSGWRLTKWRNPVAGRQSELKTQTNLCLSTQTHKKFWKWGTRYKAIYLPLLDVPAANSGPSRCCRYIHTRSLS